MAMRPVTRTMLLATAIALACGNAYAQDAAGAAPQQGPSTTNAQKTTTKAAPQTLQTVVVTGSFVPRTATDSLSPIDVLTPQQIRATGAPDLTTALRTLLPSINFEQPSNVDVSAAVRPVQLRGLTPNEVLVLINGKREHTTSTLGVDGETFATGSSGVDINAIPMNAIERIEVLRDGAGTQYGSAAISGVINIILKGGAGHGSASVTRGQYSAGDGTTSQGDVNGGIKLGQNGWLNLSATAMYQAATNRAGPDFRYPGDPTYGTVTFHDGLSPTQTKQFAANFQYDLSPNAQLYGYTILSRRAVEVSDYFRSLSQYVDDHPAAVARYPDGYRPAEEQMLYDDSEVLGLRGTMFGGWHYDISANDGGNRWKVRVVHSINYDLGESSPSDFYVGSNAIRDKSLNADFTKDFQVGWLQNPLSVAWGLSKRWETYTIKAGEPASFFESGSQGFPGFQPGDAGSHSRSNEAAYVDLQTDLTSKLTVDAGLRYEHYSDFGKTKPWKLSARYQVNKALAFRATASTSFRAPSLQQEWYSSTSLNVETDPVTGLLQFYENRTFPVSNPIAVALGAQPLQPETSHNYSFGVVLTPSNGFSATFDLYQITVNNRIIFSDSLTGDAVQSYLTSVGFPFVNGGQFFTNAINTKTQGADLIFADPLELSNGVDVNITGGFNYNNTTVTHVKPNPPQLALQGLVLPVFGIDEDQIVRNLTPRSKIFVGSDWTFGQWNVHTQLTRYGMISYLVGINGAPQSIHASYITDASVSRHLGGWLLTLGADNLFNIHPERLNEVNSFSGNFVYPHGSPIGDGGAYYYARAIFQW